MARARRRSRRPPAIVRAYLSEALTTRDLVYSGVYSMPEVLRPSSSTFAPAGALGRDGPVAAARRRGVVPGLLRAGHREQPGALACRAVRTDDACA